MSIWNTLTSRKATSFRKNSWPRRRQTQVENLESRQLMAADVAAATYEVMYTESPPTIDGTVSPAEWSDASIFENELQPFEGDTDVFDRFYMTWDSENLYMLTIARHPDWMEAFAGFDAEFDDALMLYFEPGQNDGDDTHEAAMSQFAGYASLVDGVLQNMGLDLDDWGDAFAWEAGVEISQSNEPGLGVTELKIPWLAFSSDGEPDAPQVGDTWDFNIGRRHAEDLSLWIQDGQEYVSDAPHGELVFRHSELIEEALAFEADVAHALQQLIKLNQPTVAGDSNEDGAFTTEDLVLAFQSGAYESEFPTTHAEGDWNGDGLFNSDDIVHVFVNLETQPSLIAPEQIELMQRIVSQSGQAASAARAGSFAAAAALQMAVRADFAALSSDVILASATGWIPYGEGTRFFDTAGNPISPDDLDGDSFVAVNEGGTSVSQGPDCDVLVLRNAKIVDTYSVLPDGKVKPTKETVYDAEGRLRFETDITYDGLGHVTGRKTKYYSPEDGRLIAEREVKIDSATGRPTSDVLSQPMGGLRLFSELKKTLTYDPATGKRISSEIIKNDIAAGTSTKKVERPVGGCLVRTEETRDIVTGRLTNKRIYEYDLANPKSAKKITLISYDDLGNPKREAESEWDPATGRRTGRRSREHVVREDGTRGIDTYEYDPQTSEVVSVTST